VSAAPPFAVRRTVQGSPPSKETRFRERKLAAVLFTDIVGSAARAYELGDRAWCELLEDHDRLVRDEIVRHRGREIDNSDDGFFAAFDGVSAALACAFAIRKALGELGLEIRSGVHVGEFEERGSRVGGIAVAIGARIAGHAEAGDVLVSRTVRDLALGSGITFRARGEHSLKGVPGKWQLYSLVRIGA
jgi:class 3 adenylate cyclase